MTREEAKKFLPIIAAFANDKIIQCRDGMDSEYLWKDTDNPVFSCLFQYRIKPKYEPEPGTWVMVSLDNHHYYKRFFIYKAVNTYYCLTMGDNKDFSISGDRITLSPWDYAKPLEE